jgi:kinesin family protein 6/9
MTIVLRDSLGGNSLTRMITTIHSEDYNLDESISTCKFAMRVAMIKNSLLRNEKIDPSVLIARLKRENTELKAEIMQLRNGDMKEYLTEDDRERCQDMVKQYLKDPDLSKNLVVTDQLMTYECFKIMKMMILKL